MNRQVLFLVVLSLSVLVGAKLSNSMKINTPCGRLKKKIDRSEDWYDRCYHTDEELSIEKGERFAYVDWLDSRDSERNIDYLEVNLGYTKQDKETSISFSRGEESEHINFESALNLLSHGLPCKWMAKEFGKPSFAHGEFELRANWNFIDALKLYESGDIDSVLDGLQNESFTDILVQEWKQSTDSYRVPVVATTSRRRRRRG